MKAMLVIDMPKDCWDCHLVDEWGNCNAIKITSNKYGMSIKQYNNGGRPSWCPLNPIPNEACQRLVDGLDALEKMKSVEVRVVRKTE